MKLPSFMQGMDTWLVYTIFGAVALTIALVIAAMISINKDKHANIDSLVLKRVKERNKLERAEKFGNVIFKVTKQIPILRTFVSQCEDAYLAVCPYSRPMLMRLVSNTLIVSFFVSIIVVVALLVFNILITGYTTRYSISCCVLGVYITCIEVLNYRVTTAEHKITQDLIVFISKVKHNYNVSKNIPKAISLAADGMSFEVTLHAQEMYEILTSLNRKDRVKDYVLNPKTNRYLKMFITQAYEASEKGDILDEYGVSTFISNMEFFRMDIMKDVFANQKRAYAMTGYVFVTIVPVFIMPVLKYWGLDFAPELELFYSGGGKFITILTFLATIIIYRSVNRARNISFGSNLSSVNPFEKIALWDNDNFKKFADIADTTANPIQRHVRKMLLDSGSNPRFSIFATKSVLLMIITTIIMVMFFAFTHIQERQSLRTEVNNIDNIVAIASDKQKEDIKTTILKMVDDYYSSSNLSDEHLIAGISNYMYISNKQTKLEVAKEVRSRILQCKTSYLQWWELLLSFGLGFCALFVPYLELRYKYGLVLDGRAKEVRQFQAIIIMERVFPDVTAVDLLEAMETYASYFRRSIRDCINNYSTGPKAALIRLRDTADYDDFRDLIESFINVEDIGVSVAFVEVSNNREMIEKTNELMQDIQTSKKQDRTDVISKVPALLAVGAYFIVPFGVYVFGDVDELFDMLDSFQNL